MMTSDGTEPCPTCHGGIPRGTIALHARINELEEVLDKANARIDQLAEERGKYRLRVRELESAARKVTEGWNDPHVPAGAVRHDFVANMAALAALLSPSEGEKK